MSKSTTFETALLGLIFNGTAFTNVADNAASAPVTNLYVSLHTADPGNAGNQATNETAYTGYTRVAVSRTGAGWVVAGSSVSPAAPVVFPECTGGAATIGFFGIGTDASGAGRLLYSGAVSPSLSVSTGVTPLLKTTSTVTED